jgi:alkaline phosphatase D
MTPSTNRRHLLKLASAAASTLWLPRSAWSQARFSGNPFALGVASGSPTHDSLVLWTRLVQTGLFGSSTLGTAPLTVRWEIADDEGFTRIVQSGQAQALAELAHSVHVEVAGLAPDRWYFYRFMAGDAVSPVGRTRTFPAPQAPASRLRLAYASCQRWEHGYFSAWRHMRDDQPDVVLFLGDYIYEYPGAPNAVRQPTGGWVLTLDDYRARYALHKQRARTAGHARSLPLAGDLGRPRGAERLRRADAGQQRAARGGLCRPPCGGLPGVLRAHAAARERVDAGAGGAGQRRRDAHLRPGAPSAGWPRCICWMTGSTETRRSATAMDVLAPAMVDPERCPSWDDPQRTLLGAVQEQWLDRAFEQAAGGATWNLVGQQTLFGRRDFRPGPGVTLWNDGWDGYEAARTRLTDSLQRHRLANPVLLGGDVHENWVGHVKADYARPDSAALGVEFCGTSITSRAAAADNFAALLAENPHFVFADNTRKGYGLVDFTPKHLTTTLRVVDDVTRRDTRIETLARFTVQAGRPVIEAA